MSYICTNWNTNFSYSSLLSPQSLMRSQTLDLGIHRLFVQWKNPSLQTLWPKENIVYKYILQKDGIIYYKMHTSAIWKNFITSVFTMFNPITSEFERYASSMRRALKMFSIIVTSFILNNINIGVNASIWIVNQRLTTRETRTYNWTTSIKSAFILTITIWN